MAYSKKVKLATPETDKGPSKVIGKGSFANLPSQVMIKKFPPEWNYRGGVRNSPTCSLTELTDIEENEPKDYR